MTMQAEITRAPLALPKFLAKNRLMLLFVALTMLVGVIVSHVIDVPFEIGTVSWMIGLMGSVIPAYLIVLMLAHFVYLAFVVRPKRPTQTMLTNARAVFFDFDRMATGTVTLLLFVVFFSTFSFLKYTIPYLNPFSWDVTFAEWDRVVHFGTDPYKLLFGLIGTPLVTTIINAFYHAWLFIVFFSLLAACYTKVDRAKAYTYLISHVLTWFIGGFIIATLLSSAGPVYYERLGLGDDFVPLMDTLTRFNEISPVWALHVHEMLWDGYASGGRARGISAMPSLHVASSVLMMFYAYSWRRWAGHIMAAFLAVIMIGSVMMAWHYALDGYLGVVIACICWKMSRWLVARDAAV